MSYKGCLSWTRLTRLCSHSICHINFVCPEHDSLLYVPTLYVIQKLFIMNTTHSFMCSRYMSYKSCLSWTRLTHLCSHVICHMKVVYPEQDSLIYVPTLYVIWRLFILNKTHSFMFPSYMSYKSCLSWTRLTHLCSHYICHIKVVYPEHDSLLYVPTIYVI